jgi:hypothetical protein
MRLEGSVPIQLLRSRSRRFVAARFRCLYSAGASYPLMGFSDPSRNERRAWRAAAESRLRPPPLESIARSRRASPALQRIEGADAWLNPSEVEPRSIELPV